MKRGSLALVFPIVVFACSKERPATAQEPRVPSAALALTPAVAAPSAAPAVPGQTEPAAAQAEPASASVSEANFDLSIAAKGSYEVGKPAQAEIVLVAKSPFHVNDKYPYKFKLKEEAGLSFSAPVVGKDAVVLQPARAVMTVPFSVQSPGKHTLAGQFQFSVCTDDKCLIERRELALAFEAK